MTLLDACQMVNRVKIVRNRSGRNTILRELLLITKTNYVSIRCKWKRNTKRLDNVESNLMMNSNDPEWLWIVLFHAIRLACNTVWRTVFLNLFPNHQHNADVASSFSLFHQWQTSAPTVAPASCSQQMENIFNCLSRPEYPLINIK